MSILEHTFPVNGINQSVKGFYRDDTNDWPSIASIVETDEYGFTWLGSKDNAIALDLGAHIGGATLHLAVLGYNVISVEPVRENVELLKRNLELNNFTNKVKVIHAALGKEEGTIQIYTPQGEKDSFGNIHRFICSTSKFENKIFDQTVGEIVSSITLNNILADYSIVDLVKCDVECAEWDALDVTTSDTLNKIKLIIAEVHHFKNENVMKPEHKNIFYERYFKNQFIDITTVFADGKFNRPEYNCHCVFFNKRFL